MNSNHIHTRTVALVLYIIIGVTAWAGNPLSKMSPLVRRAAISPSPTLKARGDSQQAFAVTAFVLGDGEDMDKALSENGCRVWDRQGNIRIASIPRHNIMSLASSASIRRIEASAPCQLTMDTVATVINASPIYEGRQLPQAYTGDGVVVGVMDVGFDLTHPNFRDATGQRLRIKSVWDQLSRDTVGSSLPVGRSYTTEEEIMAVGHTADGLIEHHGTHTLGSAAGSGYDTPYVGMAPGSDICVVGNAVTSNIEIVDSADIYRYTSATDALGFKYLFDYADSQGKPCVASFSEGYRPTFDSEDSLYCAYLNTIMGKGHIIVVSAGNESYVNNGKYIGKPLGKSEAGAMLYSRNMAATILVNGSGDYAVRLVCYDANENSHTMELPINGMPMDSTVTTPLLTADGDTLLSVTTLRYMPSMQLTTPACLLQVSSDENLHEKDIFFMLTGAQAECEARVMSSSTLFTNVQAEGMSLNNAESTHNIQAPGCFPGIITVGATVHRQGYTNHQGEFYTVGDTHGWNNRRAYFSSVGPAADGSVKPTVMAPGMNILSSYSSYYLENHPDEDTGYDTAFSSWQGRTYPWGGNSGTSMSTPVVAGVIALWLEACPTLTPQDVEGVISRTATHNIDTLSYPNNEYGYGEIDAYRGLLDVLSLSNISGISTWQPRALKMVPTPEGNLSLTISGTPASALRITLYTTAGVKVLTTEVASPVSGRNVVQLPSLPRGVYAVQADSTEPDCCGSSLVRLGK